MTSSPDSTKDIPKQRSIHALCAIFFLSGASALMFETVWFRLAGITLGNSVWASALVLSGFMGGLSLGNGLVAFRGYRWPDPVRMYALIEIIIAVSGILLVLLFPVLTGWFTPVFQVLLDYSWALNASRLVIAFVLLLVPATAMGMTLPLLVKALYGQTPNFGQVLGRLYGWNTLGAVAGALLPEAVLIGAVGLRSTGLVAGLFNLLAAAGALYVARAVLPAGWPNVEAPRRLVASAMLSKPVVMLLIASIVCGGTVLALEVVWFRFLILFVNAFSIAFAIMLAVVLAGIALGGMAGAAWFRRQADAHRYTAALALTNGVLVLAIYSLFNYALQWSSQVSHEWVYVFALSAPLMFPVCFVSGMLFTFIGQMAYDKIGGTLETTGLVTMVNTGGAMAGSVVAGLCMIPGLGMEKSFFVLACCYFLVALLTLRTVDLRSSWTNLLPNAAALAAFGAAVVLFPFGIMEERILSVGRKWFGMERGMRPLAICEGPTETSQYWVRELFDKRVYTRLITNNHLMAATGVANRRYMNLYVYWPVAIHPNPKRALLICYGVGNTARALDLTRNLASIDVVDISQDILERSHYVYPNPQENPLKDPRVRVHVEDGRFFLQTTRERFDIITGEPPPPEMATVVNLYSQEYFQAMYDRLEEGGIVTYWLPVPQLGVAGTAAIAKAFCNVFPDCSLWNGSGYNWMLVGTRNAKGPATEDHFRRQWADPLVSAELRSCGLELPEQLGATFMMDAEGIRKWTRRTEPLVDNCPNRISARFHRFAARHSPEDLAQLNRMMNEEDLAEQFRTSSAVKQWFPESLITRSLDFFPIQPLINEATVRSYISDPGLNIVELHRVLTGTTLRFPVFLLMGGTKLVDIDQAIGPADSGMLQKYPDMAFHLSTRAFADRDYTAAAEYLEKAQELKQRPHLVYYHIYALIMAQRADRARTLIADNKSAFASPEGARYLQWLAATFGVRKSCLKSSPAK